MLHYNYGTAITISISILTKTSECNKIILIKESIHAKRKARNTVNLGTRLKRPKRRRGRRQDSTKTKYLLHSRHNDRDQPKYTKVHLKTCTLLVHGLRPDQGSERGLSHRLRQSWTHLKHQSGQSS